MLIAFQSNNGIAAIDQRSTCTRQIGWWAENYEEGRLITDSIGVRTWPRSTRLSIGPSWKAGAGVIRLPSWNGIISTSVSIVHHPRSWASASMSIRETSLYRGPPSALSRWRSMANVTWILGKIYRMVHLSLSYETSRSFFFFFFLEILRYGMKVEWMVERGVAMVLILL